MNPVRIAANLWRYRDLAWQFTRRNIELRHRGSRLGHFWALINPLSMLVLYFFVFGLLLRTKFGALPEETNYDYLLAVFLSLSLFHVFSETLSASPMLITGNPNFVKKVVFPLEVLPLAQLGATAFHLCIGLGLVLVGSIFGSPGLSWQALWLPVLMLPLLLLSLGLGWALSALGVFLRDIGQLTAFAATAVMFASAVMYPTSLISQASPEIWRVLRFNPLLQIIDLARHVVLWHEPMPWTRLGYIYACAIAIVILGHACFGLLRRSFADVI